MLSRCARGSCVIMFHARYQKEMEKIRDHFSEPELFRLREEFNDVDADRSGCAQRFKYPTPKEKNLAEFSNERGLSCACEDNPLDKLLSTFSGSSTTRSSKCS